MTLTGNEKLRLYAVGLFVLMALGQHWLSRQRPLTFADQVQSELSVVNPADAGPGTLRDAIFSADRSNKRTRIVLKVKRLVLSASLPALINAEGVVLESGVGETVIDAHALTGGPALQIDAPRSLLRAIRIDGAVDTGILVRSPQVRLEKIAVINSGVGITVAAAIVGTQITGSTFENNRDAVRLDGSGISTEIRQNTFKANTNAGIWMVRGQPDAKAAAADHRITDNHFEANGMAIVVGNDSALIERNVITAHSHESIMLMNSDAIVRSNHILRNAGTAISIENGVSTQITSNEIDHNKGVGVLVRSGRALIENNRLYENGSGIVSLFGLAANPSTIRGNLLMDHSEDALVVIGGSPLVQNNRILRARQAGLRVLDYNDGRSLSKAAPLLEGNVLQGNHLNELQRGVFQPVKGATS